MNIPSLSIGDQVKILDTNEIGIICRNRNSGAYDVQMDSGGERICLYGDELELLEKAVQCSCCPKRFLESKGYFNFTSGKECPECGEQHWPGKVKDIAI